MNHNINYLCLTWKSAIPTEWVTDPNNLHEKTDIFITVLKTTSVSYEPQKQPSENTCLGNGIF